tara:strand:+ start:1363 stop:2985 length:1623 start_codon:yes stop_codon:yes gene_type:complete
MQDLGYSPKQLSFDEKGRKKLIRGIETISHAVKSTLGPRGKTVLIESQNHTHGITVTKDGVTVARSIDLLDPVENLAVKIMKQAADKTSRDAGDGTTTAIVLTEAIVKAMYALDNLDELNVTEVLRQLDAYCHNILMNLTNKSRKLNKKKVVDVATISSNNDKELGKIIGDTYNEVGKDGIVTVEKSQSSDTYSEVTQGFKLDRGYSSNLFINNQKKDECILEDVYVFVSDCEINNILNIEKALKPIITDGKKLLIIAPCSGNVINTLAANVMKNGLKICVIQPPNFGWKQKELMGDIAFSLKASYFSESTGDDLSHVEFGDLGHAKKVIIGRDSSIIIKDDEGVDPEKTDKRVEELWEQHKITKNNEDQVFILERIAALKGGIGVIHVGGLTDLEQKEKFDRVDDAVCAVRSALQDGILPGGGIALYDEAERYENHPSKSREEDAAIKIFRNALRAPFEQIMLNSGKPIDLLKTYVNGSGKQMGYGYDIKREKYGNLLDMGVIDPAKVTKSALANAVSVAITILSTNAIITLARTYDSE